MPGAMSRSVCKCLWGRPEEMSVGTKTMKLEMGEAGGGRDAKNKIRIISQVSERGQVTTITR